MKKFLLTILSISILLPGIAQKNDAISGKSAFKRVDAGKSNDVKKIRAFPNLIIRGEAFEDTDGNKRIDGNERAVIRFTVENIGVGTAKGVVAFLSVKSGQLQGLGFRPKTVIGDIAAGGKPEIIIPVEGTFDLTDGLAEFRIEVKEDQGFDAFPLEMKVEMHHFEPPHVIIADAVFSTKTGGKPELNMPMQLKFVVQNIGKSRATRVQVSCRLPENCPLTGETDQFSIDTLPAGENREFDLLFIATRRYTAKNIPVRIKVSEDFGKYGQDTVISMNLNQELLPQSAVMITAVPSPETQIKKVSLTSSVDKNIPLNVGTNSGKFALVIGNEEYTRFQPSLQNEMNVPFARNDASVFREYLVRTLGFLPENVYLLLDATAGEMNQKIDLIAKLAAKTGEKAEVVFYYAGHGLPDETSRMPYLIPVDVNGTNLAPAVKLDDVYQKLGTTNASRITVFLDACFSGGGRETGLLAARGVKIRPIQGALTGKMVVFTASKGDQSAMPYCAEKHGLFTFFLLKKLQETSGKINYGDLAGFLMKTVSLESLKINQKEQDAVVKASGEADGWEKWEMKSEK